MQSDIIPPHVLRPYHPPPRHKPQHLLPRINRHPSLSLERAIRERHPRRGRGGRRSSRKVRLRRCHRGGDIALEDCGDGDTAGRRGNLWDFGGCGEAAGVDAEPEDGFGEVGELAGVGEAAALEEGEGPLDFEEVGGGGVVGEVAEGEDCGCVGEGLEIEGGGVQDGAEEGGYCSCGFEGEVEVRVAGLVHGVGCGAEGVLEDGEDGGPGEEEDLLEVLDAEGYERSVLGCEVVELGGFVPPGVESSDCGVCEADVLKACV